MLKASSNAGLVRSFAVSRTHSHAYTGGPIAHDADGRVLACSFQDRVALLNVETGRVEGVIPEVVPGEDVVDAITCFAFSPASASTLVTFARSQLARVWDTSSRKVVRTWKAHKLPVRSAAFDVSGTLVATGSADRSVRVWDIDHGHATHKLEGHTAPVTVCIFQPCTGPVNKLVSGAEDGHVRLWDLVSSACLVCVREHSSAVTALAFSPDRNGYCLFTAGADKMLHMWDTPSMERGDASESCLIASVPVMEALAGLVTLPQGTGTTGDGVDAAAAGGRAEAMLMITAGDGGVLRQWSVRFAASLKTSSRVKATVEEVDHVDVVGVRQRSSVRSRGKSGFRGRSSVPAPADTFTALFSMPAPATAGKSKRPRGKMIQDVMAVTGDHVLSLLRSADLSIQRTLLGWQEHVVDVAVVPQHGGADLLAVASNSPDLRLLDAQTFEARCCPGHTDAVVCVAASADGTLVATGSKDCAVRVWDVATGVCVATCQGHTAAIEGVVWPKRASGSLWLVSVSSDRTLKRWDLRALAEALPVPRNRDASEPAWSDVSARKAALRESPRTAASVVSHEKGVHALDVAPTDRLLATGGADKLVRLWSVEDLLPIATLSGHKRGVWAVAFSPAEQLLVSASGDRTLRVWSMARDGGYACLRALEGHDAAVLRVAFLPGGAQMLSGGADGVVKLWSVRPRGDGDDSTASLTLEAGTEKVWALTSLSPPSPRAEGEQEAQRTQEFVCAGAEGVITVWHDSTQAVAEAELAAVEEGTRARAKLGRALAERSYEAAATLALELDAPAAAADAWSALLDTPVSSSPAGGTFRDRMLAELDTVHALETGVAPSVAAAADDTRVKRVLRKLTPLQLGRLLLYVREWNTQSKHGMLAQQLWRRIQTAISAPLLGAALVAVRDTVNSGALKVVPGVGTIRTSSETPSGSEPATVTAPEAELRAYASSLLPYTERHADRMQRLQTSSYVVDYTLAAMKAAGVSVQPLSLASEAAAALRRTASTRETAEEDEEAEVMSEGDA